MVAVDGAYLVGRQVRGDVGEVAPAYVVASLDDILKHVLHVAVVARRDALAANFIERLTGHHDVALDGGIAAHGEHAGDVARVGSVEPVGPCVAPHRSGVDAVAIALRRSDLAAILADDFKHRRLARADVAPDPQTLVGIVAPVEHQAPPHDVVQQRLHVGGDGEARADIAAHVEKFNFLLAGYAS